MTFHAVVLAKRGVFTLYLLTHWRNVGFENIPYFCDTKNYLMNLRNKV
jgi:hypothetical protein